VVRVVKFSDVNTYIGVESVNHHGCLFEVTCNQHVLVVFILLGFEFSQASTHNHHQVFPISAWCILEYESYHLRTGVRFSEIGSTRLKIRARSHFVFFSGACKGIKLMRCRCEYSLAFVMITL